MPWRLIIVILIFAVFMTFITFNLENRCDINFGFTQLLQVPVFLTVFVSFALGLLCALPFAMHLKKKAKHPVVETKPASSAISNEPVNPSEARQKFLSRFRGKKSQNGGFNDT